MGPRRWLGIGPLVANAVLAVAEPTKFEVVVNLRTVSSLGLSLTPALLARADEMIE
jgi:putative tryptophan/tyrosine transport system substrate-binding protein